jgi:hypothetical protein
MKTEVTVTIVIEAPKEHVDTYARTPGRIETTADYYKDLLKRKTVEMLPSDIPFEITLEVNETP